MCTFANNDPTRSKRDELFYEEMWGKDKPSFHVHKDENGILHKCYHKSKSVIFWIITWVVTNTLAFPVEHLIWEKAPIFKDITHWLGL